MKESNANIIAKLKTFNNVDEIKFKDQKILGTVKGGKPHIIENSS